MNTVFKHVKVCIDGAEEGADKNRARSDGRTPLHAAAENGHSAVASLLLSKGANAFKRTNGYLGRTPAQVAACHSTTARIFKAYRHEEGDRDRGQGRDRQQDRARDPYAQVSPQFLLFPYLGSCSSRETLLLLLRPQQKRGEMVLFCKAGTVICLGVLDQVRLPLDLKDFQF